MKNIGLQNLLERPPATPFDDEVFKVPLDAIPGFSDP